MSCHIREACAPLLEGLPGGDLVAKGLEDLAHSRPTPEAALVEVARRRFAELGFDVSDRTVGPDEDADLVLYARLGNHFPARDTHALYCAWVDQLVSFLASARPPRSGAA